MPSLTRGAGRPVRKSLAVFMSHHVQGNPRSPRQHNKDNVPSVAMSTYETVVERHIDGVMRFVLWRRVYYRIVSYSKQSVDVFTRLPLQLDAGCKYVADCCNCTVELMKMRKTYDTQRFCRNCRAKCRFVFSCKEGRRGLRGGRVCFRGAQATSTSSQASSSFRTLEI